MISRLLSRAIPSLQQLQRLTESEDTPLRHLKLYPSTPSLWIVEGGRSACHTGFVSFERPI
jgi:hypothetical protein